MGKNLATPFHRAARDFATASGANLFLAKVAQILGTEADSPVGTGELPWRTAFGSTIHLLRHKPNNEALVEVARVRARNALAQWLPGARVSGATSRSDGALLTVVLSVAEVATGGAPSGASGDVPVPIGPGGPS